MTTLDVPTNSAYLTWQQPMSLSLTNMSELVVLETGIGKGSEFLINNFKQVYSFESNWSSDWYSMCTAKSTTNWTTMYYDLNRTDSYLKTLENFISTQTIDVVLVDHAAKGSNPSDPTTRGDVASYCMKIGIEHVFVHDYPNNNYYYNISDKAAVEYGYTCISVGYDTGYYKKETLKQI